MPILKFKTDKMFTDITDDIEKIVPKKFDGLVNVYSPHTTCCVFQTENELLHLVDIRFFLDKLVPYVKQPEGEHRNVKYLHDMISLREGVPVDEPINGHSHIRSMFFNSSENIPIKDSKLLLGQLEFYSSNSFTVLGEEEKSLFESSPGAASLDKLETVDVKTRTASINALRVIDRALDRIHMERAKLGALMSRMEKAIDNLTNVSVNTEASRGRIRDANFAKESASLTKAQILQQSALAMIAQAGRIQQNVLTLLQN